MNKSDLIANIAMDANLTKSQAAAALQAVEDAIAAALAEGGSVSWIGFGTFP